MKYKVGDRIGRLVILSIERVHIGKQTRNYCICKCDCGNTTRVRMDSLGTSGNGVRSCGCFCREQSSIRQTTHHQTDSPTYISWQSMKSRCMYIHNASYNEYGERGIKICDRWLHSFENFLEDMGERPSKEYTIDRIDVNGNYEPSNCRWATMVEQQNNKRNSVKILLNGKEYSIKELAALYNIKESRIWNWRRNNLDIVNKLKKINHGREKESRTCR